MKSMITRMPIIVVALFIGLAAMAQTTAKKNLPTIKTTPMKTYLIERDIPGAGKLTADELKTISKTSCNVLKEMGPQISGYRAM